MSEKKKKLLVEGDADTNFYAACLIKAGFNVKNDFFIGPAIAYDPQKSPGKGNAIALLPSLIDQMEQELVTHLALVVDADYSKTNGLGFDETLKKIKNILDEKSYDTTINLAEDKGGFCFKNKDGLPNVGLWIMPDNASSGFIENFISTSLIESEKKFFKCASNAVLALRERRFNDLHESKANVATWLAWQKIPGQGMASAIGNDFINLKKGQGKKLIDWLKLVYSD